MDEITAIPHPNPLPRWEREDANLLPSREKAAVGLDEGAKNGVDGKVKAFIGLGSNLGDRRQNILSAVEMLGQIKGVHVVAISTVIETKPVGPIQDQPDFLNAVVSVKTDIEPLELLDRLLSIETQLGRLREKRWGPRTIDLDILLYGDRIIDQPQLRVPHPEIQNRPFILEALQELGASLPSPISGEGGKSPDEGYE